MNVSYLRELIARFGLTRIESTIASSARTSAIYFPAKAKSLSKFGGIPQVPSGFHWPLGERGAFRFICQIEIPNLTNINPQLLTLFVENSDSILSGSVKVYSFDTNDLKTPEVPAHRITQEHFLESRQTFVLPRHIPWTQEGPDFRRLGLKLEEADNYSDLVAALDDKSNNAPIWARLWHHPEHWYESALYIERVCAKTKVANESKALGEHQDSEPTWSPLLVLPSNQTTELILGDLENLVVWIRTEWDTKDLSNLRISIEG